MAIRRGSSTPSAIYRGATAVQKVMRGTVEVWSAVPPYAASGAIPAQAGERQHFWKTVASHTMTSAVQSATISATVVWNNVGASTYKVAINVNGLQVAVNETAPPSGSGRSQSVSATIALAAGDVISFHINSGHANAANRSITGGSWSVNG